MKDSKFYQNAKGFFAWLGPFLTWTLPRLAAIVPSLAAMAGVHGLMKKMGATDFVANSTALSFELAIIALALAAFETDDELNRAEWIRRGSLAVSVLFNVADQFFALRPWILGGLAAEKPRPVGLDWALALLHGVPVPVIGFFMSGLVLHAAKGLTRAQLQALLDELRAKYDVVVAALEEMAGWRDKAVELEQKLQQKELEALMAVPLPPAVAPAPPEEKKLTPKTALRKLRTSGLTLKDLAKAALESAPTDKAAAAELGITVAQIRALAKDV